MVCILPSPNSADMPSPAIRPRRRRPWIVHHDEKHGLSPQWLKLFVILLPALDGRGQVASIFHAGIFGFDWLDFGDSLHRALDHVLYDGLLQRIVGDGPGKDDARFGEAWRG